MFRRQEGQGLVEFALISPVLLGVILAIIEAALIFQGYLTVQHAAREAARWAVTYRPDKGMTLEGEPCDGVGCNPDESDREYWERRVGLIKLKAIETAIGLRIDDTRLGLDEAAFNEYASAAGFYGVEVWGFPSFDEPKAGWSDDELRDHPGLPGLPVRVRVTHNVELLDPIFRAIVPRVRVVAQAEMINEGIQAGFGNVAPPSLPPPPPLPTPDWESGIVDAPSPPPDDVPGMASIGGLIEVLSDEPPVKMPGVQVQAFAPDGAEYRTATTLDGTYRVYNLPPDTYTIYAEVWVDGVLYSSSKDVTVAADERNYGVDLLLQ
jgi:hypothetical protein